MYTPKAMVKLEQMESMDGGGALSSAADDLVKTAFSSAANAAEKESIADAAKTAKKDSGRYSSRFELAATRLKQAAGSATLQRASAPASSASAPAWQAQATAAGWRAPNSAHEMALALLHEPAESTSAHELALGLLNRVKMERDVETVESMDADRGGAWWREQEPADESAAQDEPEPAETFLARIAARGDELQGRRL